jgi:hypothetical protein
MLDDNAAVLILNPKSKLVAPSFEACFSHSYLLLQIVVCHVAGNR